MEFTDLAVSGPLLLAAVVAVLAGAVSFASPCVIPLVPGYLAYLSGLLGFSAVFTVTVVTVLGIADQLLLNESTLQRVGGVVTIAMGLVFVGLVPALQRDVRVHPRPGLGPRHVLGVPVLGAVFGLGWTPCLGLGVPFLLLALGARWAVRAVSWLRGHVRAVQLAGGGMLVLVGVLLVTGMWGEFIALLQGPIQGFETPI